MRIVGLRSGWVKAAMLTGAAVLLAGCQTDGPDEEDFAQPAGAHYERHPIIVTQTGAHAKECGAWPEDLSEMAQNQPYENFGCSQQNNIAAMVAYPQDLEQPRTQTQADAMRRIKSIDKYRAGEQIGSAEEEKQKIEISKIAGSN
jgi:type IV pilus biogenesis protein CpaD/CtpE